MLLHKRLVIKLAVCLQLTLTLVACGGGANRETAEVEPEVVQSPWEKTAVTQVTDGGLLSTHVAAVPDQFDNNIVHFVYLLDAHEVTEENPNPPIEYILTHGVWNLALGEMVSTQAIVTLDNTLEFSLTIDPNNTLYVAYRGGNVAHCNTKQSDAMLAVKTVTDESWQEYTGAIGYSGDRNPAYTDGDAGDYPTIAVDSSGNVHMAFQFFWEGCDSNNALHPDVLYVQKTVGAFDSFENDQEEQVEGNDYAGTNYQNAVGYHNSLVLDAEENPVVFYGAREINYRDYGLRMAARVNGIWQAEWVDEGCVIGDVSAAVSPDGVLAVAYYIEECTEHISYTEDDGYALRFAMKVEGEWQIHTVDEATKAGSYTKLVFDNLGNPAIAYYETESYGIGNQRDLYNLKLAQLDVEDNTWFVQRVEETGDVGVFNSLWFDEENTIYISSYSNTDRTIYLFRAEAEPE